MRRGGERRRKKLHKYLINLFFFVTKLDGAIRRRPSSPEPEPVAIPNRSRIYVQLPGDHVLQGILEYREDNPLPSWVYPPYHVGNSSQPRVLVKTPFFGDMLGHLQTLHNNHNNNVRIFRVFIPLSNFSILTASLRPGNNTLEMPRNTRVFVRLPDPYNAIYFGILRFGDGWRPEWIPIRRNARN